MNIRLDNADINVDDHGAVMLFERQGHGEVVLGSIDDKSQFTPAFWLEPAPSFGVDLRRALAAVYFGEKQGITRRKQAEWPEYIVQYINPSEFSLGRNLRLVSHDGRSRAGETGRYRDDDGLGLHGLYMSQSNGIIEKILIGHGRSLLTYRQPSAASLRDWTLLNDDNLKLSTGVEWSDEDGAVLPRGKIIQSRVLQGLLPMGEYFLLGRERVEAHLTRASESACGILAYPHQRDAGKYRIVIHRGGDIAKAMDLPALREEVKTLLSAWSSIDGYAGKVQSIGPVVDGAFAKLSASSFARLAQDLDQPGSLGVAEKFLSSFAQGLPLACIIDRLLDIKSD